MADDALWTDDKEDVGVVVTTGVVTGPVFWSVATIELYSPLFNVLGVAEIVRTKLSGLMLCVESQLTRATINRHDSEKMRKCSLDILFLQKCWL